MYNVNKTEFQNCTVPEGEGYRTGHDEIPLLNTGKKWYISGVPKYCSDRRQKLAINVIKSLAPAPVPMALMPPMTPMTPQTPVDTPSPPANSAYGTQ